MRRSLCPHVGNWYLRRPLPLCLPAILSIFLSACSLIDPGGGRWTHLGLDGRWVTALADTEWGLFAGTHEQGVFRYDEASAAWEPLSLDQGAVASLVFLPGPPPRLLAGMASYYSEAAVFATEDAGANWMPSDGGLVALANENGGYFRVNSLTPDPFVPGRVYMNGDASVLVSNDNGHTWAFILGTITSGGSAAVAMAVSTGNQGQICVGGQNSFGIGVLTCTRDGGETWESTCVPRGCPAVDALAIDPLDGQRVWAASGSGVLVSPDEGQTWERSLDWRPADNRRADIHALTFVGNTLFAAGAELETDTLPPFPEGLRLFAFVDDGVWWAADVPTSTSAWSIIADRRGDLVIGTRGSGVWRFGLD
jgi:hypothetical protein